MLRIIYTLIISCGVWLFVQSSFAAEQLPKPKQASTKPYGGQLCHQPQYHCMRIPANSSWAGLWSNKRERDVLMRLNRSNVELKYRQWVVVPNHLKHLSAMDVSPFPDVIHPPGEKVIIVNLNLQAYAAYNANGHQVYWGPATSGQAWCSDVKRPCLTVTGVFRIFRKAGADCFSRTYPVGDGGTPMPYCMFFHQGYALHGAEVPSVPSTHGCVGMYNNDARWLNQDFVTVGPKKGTLVIVLH